MDAGTWIEAAAAVGTLAAVVVALWIGIRDGRERDAERRDAEAAQARLVMVSDGNLTGDVLPVVFTNHSREPVLGLELEGVRWGDEEVAGVTWRVPPTIWGAHANVDVLPAGESHTVPVEFLNPEGNRIGLGMGSFTARYSFRDARGLAWRRTHNGEPERVLQET